LIAFLGYIISPKCSEILEISDILNIKECSIACSIRLKIIIEKYNIKPIAIFENLHYIEAKTLAYSYLKALPKALKDRCLFNSKLNKWKLLCR